MWWQQTGLKLCIAAPTFFNLLCMVVVEVEGNSIGWGPNQGKMLSGRSSLRGKSAPELFKLFLLLQRMNLGELLIFWDMRISALLHQRCRSFPSYLPNL